ncbi:MAG: cytochrome c [Pseudomonadota bacterium]|nr:cytochrome c [Pseudomonadota bacterium]
MSDRKFLDLRRHFPSVAFVVVIALVMAGFLGIFIYAGVYDIGADAPHMAPIYWLIEHLRDRSIAVRARGIKVPSDLADPSHIAAGAGLYAEMCSGCHLAPGMEKTEISQGLYPPAPELGHGVDLSPAETFWIIKHGVKLTAMPAWGRTHSDTLIWDMVAFVRKMPSLSAARYQATVKSAPADHDEMMHDMMDREAPVAATPAASPGPK